MDNVTVLVWAFNDALINMLRAEDEMHRQYWEGRAQGVLDIMYFLDVISENVYSDIELWTIE